MAGRNADPLDFPDETLVIPAAPVFEFRNNKNPFQLWEATPCDEPDGVYQPIHFALEVTPEQAAILDATRKAFSQEIINCCHAYIEFYQNNPKPVVKQKKKKKQAGKPCKSRWQRKLVALGRQIKADLLNKGWPGRLVNGILVQARAKLDSANEIAKRELKLAEFRFKERPDNHTHGRLQYWKSRQGYNHFCLGDRKALQDKAKHQAKIGALQAQEQTREVFERLLVLYQLKAEADKAWSASRLWPIFSIGGEGKWRNKATFIRPRKGAPTELEFVITYPRFLKPGHKGRLLPKLVIPIKLSERAQQCWEDALKHKKALTFTIQPLNGNRWRVTGVYKEPKVAKFSVLPGKRIGIDQNAGFITVACVDGKKLLWVRKIRISQKGSTEEHEGRICAAMELVCSLAQLEQAIVVIEDLNLVEKHKAARSKRARRHIQRIPYRKTQEILGRLCCRQGLTLKAVHPAYTSILGRFKLPGMNVHLSAAAMIAWRDLGLDQVELFQVGHNCLKIQGEDSPLVVEVEEGMPLVRSNQADPRFLASLYRFIQGVNASINHDGTERKADGQSGNGSKLTVSPSAHGRELRDLGSGRSTVHEPKRPAAGAGPRLKIRVSLQPAPSRKKSSKTVAPTA